MIVSPDITGNMDGSVLRIAGHIKTDIPIVPITRIDGFKFNPELLKLGKWILLDYSELWWNSENTDTHLFGKNTSDFPQQFPGDDWKQFDDFVRNNPPVIYFKRELLNKDRSDFVHPIDYPCWEPPYPIQSREEFNSRPISCFYYWGRSSERRVKLHSDVWRYSSKNGSAVCDNLFYLNAFLKEEKSFNKWVTVNIAHYSRQPIETILAINGLSKISVSMRGSGHKCFRDVEASVNSVMIMEAGIDICYAYPWEHGVNCFRMYGEPIGEIEKALASENLYDVYLSGMETIDKYRVENYINNYINKVISQYANNR